ncbi:MAG: EAL domain-containing protein [Frankiaceae bacterium]|nr:EAL domain-containing protein [Frankiaceae bacterium]MBV9871482.1 EAL domain-containing protein [Frankiaceae bacterium]
MVSADVVTICALLAVAILVLLLRRASADRQRLARATSQLARSKQELQATAEAVPAGIFRTEIDGSITFVNQRLTEIVGRIDIPHCDNVPIHPDDLPGVITAWTDAQRSQRPFRSQFRIERPDGEIRWVDVECRALTDANGKPTSWVGSCWDATDELATWARLRRLSEILEATPDLVAMIDAKGVLTHANVAMRARFGIPVDGPLPPIEAADLYAPYERQRFLTEAISTAERDEVWIGEIDLMLFDGTTVPVSQVIVAHRHTDGSIDYYSSITRDLSEQRAFEAQLAKAEWYDPVTALPNRAFFIDAIEVCLERSARSHSRLSVLVADIDHFKLVNDSLGHVAGDQMLQAVAERLRVAAGPSVLLARFGSDEFCLLVEDVDTEGPVQLAERIADQLSAPIEIDGDPIFVTVSTGIALSSGNGGQDTPEGLLRDADAALHRAKERGRARAELFIEDFRHTAVNQLRTASDLHRALDGGEFRVVYQPEVDLRSGHIVAVEALVRWHHPERGLVPPAEFIPLAEQTGLITGIGHWVLTSAIKQAAEWSTARWNGTGLLVWVNLSARQLSDENLVDEVAAALREHGVAPHQLGLEITETALLQDAEGAVAALGALRSLGVRLAIDDFGTGYSSLSYLKRLPVDAVKVDRSFVDGLALDGDDSAIVAAVTGMARALRLTTIAEGVESIGQLFALRRLGCDLAQGFFFTTPQPPSHITRLLEDDRGAGLFSYEEAVGDVAGVLPRPRREAILPPRHPQAT